MTGAHRDAQPPQYEIRVRGRLGETICSAFPDLKARPGGDDTVLVGVLADQAAPGHVQEVRRLVLDPLTKARARQLRDIGRRNIRTIDPGLALSVWRGSGPWCQR